MPQPTISRSSRYQLDHPLTSVPCDLPPLIEVKIAAQLGSFSEKFIRDQLNLGVIRGCKIGKAWRVNRDAYLKQLGLD